MRIKRKTIYPVDQRGKYTVFNKSFTMKNLSKNDAEEIALNETLKSKEYTKIRKQKKVFRF